MNTKEQNMGYTDWGSSAKIEDMVGKVFTSIRNEDTELVFENATERFVFFHAQDCCEHVSIEDVCGDLEDLVGEPLLIAEEVSGETPVDFNEMDHESVTWTFYKFATRKGYVDVRWLGESNGYYSEGVSLGRELVDRA
jgi:hypothetical protein